VISATNLEAILRAHGYLRVERPPELWALRTDDEAFLFLLGEMIVLALGRASELGKDHGDHTQNVSNVVVPEDAAGDGLPEGELVAITLLGPGDGTAGQDGRRRVGRRDRVGASYVSPPCATVRRRGERRWDDWSSTTP
jgi:hypothetical protein